MIYVVCSNHRQFENFCREQCVSPKNKRFKYVWVDNAMHNLRGIQNPEVILYGTWNENVYGGLRMIEFIESRWDQ